MLFGKKICLSVWAKASDLAFKACKCMIKCVDAIAEASKAENKKSKDENHVAAIKSFVDCMKKIVSKQNHQNVNSLSQELNFWVIIYHSRRKINK